MSSKAPFERVVADHGLTVLRVCRSLLPEADADDAWSETFLAALRAYPLLPDDANHEAWLVTLAHRKAIDQLRRRGRLPTPSQETLELPSTYGLPGDTDTAALWTHVRALPRRQRQVIGYHYLGGLTYPEIAALLGGSVESARRAAADGLRGLRRALDAEQAAIPSVTPSTTLSTKGASA